MPKMKTKRAAAKRFKPRASGSIKRAHATKRHILSHRTTKNKRHLRGMVTVHESDIKSVKRHAPLRLIQKKGVKDASCEAWCDGSCSS